MNPSFIEYSSYFSFFKNNSIGLVPKKYNLFSDILKLFSNIFQNSLKRITLRSIRLPFLHKIDLEKEYTNTRKINFHKILHRNRIILFHGFLFGENFELIENQRKYLSQLFSFSEEIQGQCLDVIRSINKNKIIGICMRQGDYKDHFNGKKFYLTDEEYSRLISRLQLQYPDHGIFIAMKK